MVQATTIQIHHKAIKAAIPAKVVAAVVGEITTTSVATTNKASVVARCVQIIIINGAIHMATATIAHRIIMALVSFLNDED